MDRIETSDIVPARPVKTSLDASAPFPVIAVTGIFNNKSLSSGVTVFARVLGV